LYAERMSLFTWSEFITVGACVGDTVVPDALVPVPVVLPVAVELVCPLLIFPVELSADPAWLPTLEGAPLLGLDCD